MAAVEELTSDGVDFVFNTPNPESRAGYLTMGWQDAGRIPHEILPGPALGSAPHDQGEGPGAGGGPSPARPATPSTRWPTSWPASPTGPTGGG